MKRRKGDIGVVVGLIIVGILLGRFQTTARNSGKTDLISRLVRTLVAPASNLIGGAANASSNLFGVLGHGKMLEDENRRLRAIAQAAESYDSNVDRLEGEIGELRKLGGWQEIGGREKVPADVIGFFPHESRITLSVGGDQGIKRGMPVATYEGLVGRIETVDKSTSQALLISSPATESHISALVQTQSVGKSTAGLLRGDGASSLSIELADPSAVVSPGDLVTTSGFSEEIPRGIAIGRIVSVQDDKAFGKRTATIQPSVPLGLIREVFVIK